MEYDQDKSAYQKLLREYNKLEQKYEQVTEEMTRNKGPHQHKVIFKKICSLT